MQIPLPQPILTENHAEVWRHDLWGVDPTIQMTVRLVRLIDRLSVINNNRGVLMGKREILARSQPDRFESDTLHQLSVSPMRGN